jgi:uncharacterized paraquat-inducible protein A|tara:strand:+ start:531 stop:770 length:240 start_codon:yes stop_codon:yes gene_type:complete
MLDRDFDKILDTLDQEDENKDIEYADDWYCMECDYGPMNDEHDKCGRCGEPHPTMKKRDTTNEDGWEDENIEAELEEIY